MRLILNALALFAFSMSVAAQTTCGLPGVTSTVSPAVAPPGTPILVTLTNNSASTIQLPSGCTISSVHAGLTCDGATVVAPFCPSVITPIAPGQAHSFLWSQTDHIGNQVLEGTYAFSISYWDLNFTTLTSCCPTVVISSNPGAGFCFGGAGGGVACPCGNPGGFLEGCHNSTGQGARLMGSGNPTIGADSVVLTASQCPASLPSLFFSGPNALAGLPFGDGLRCVGGTVVRLGTLSTDASGSVSTPWTLSIKEGLAPGDLRHYQLYYRDPSGPCGSTFNTTNGYTIQW